MNFHLGCKVITLMIYLFAFIGGEVRCDGPQYNPSREYNFPTYYPNAINTTTVKLVETKTLLVFDIAVLERAIVRNTGKSVEVLINQTTKDGVYGGVLYPDRYVFKKFRYYWTKRTDAKARAATTVDDKGEALELLLVYWNEKYGSFEKALDHRDGLVLGAIPIHIGLVLNPGFIPTQGYLAQVKEARTQVPAELGTTYIQYGTTTPFIYYAYPGSYEDEDTGKTYFCATVIAGLIIQHPFISTEQFQSFLDLRNDVGEPLTNQATLHRDKRVPVVQGMGTIDMPQVG